MIHTITALYMLANSTEGSVGVQIATAMDCTVYECTSNDDDAGEPQMVITEEGEVAYVY